MPPLTPLLTLRPHGRRARHIHPARTGVRTSQQPLRGWEVITIEAGTTTKHRPMLPHVGMGSDFTALLLKRLPLSSLGASHSAATHSLGVCEHGCPQVRVPRISSWWAQTTSIHPEVRLRGICHALGVQLCPGRIRHFGRPAWVTSPLPWWRRRDYEEGNR